MTTENPFKYFETSPKIIRLVVMYFVRYPLSFRQVEDILYERGTLIRVRLCQPTPPSASPDCKLAHNCVNNRVVSVRYRRAFCVMHGLWP